MTTQDTTTVTSMVVAYHGDAVADKTIDVRDLAPGLIALGEVFQRANQLSNGATASVSLRVRANSPGSFEVDLLMQLVFTTTTLFSGPLFTSAANLKELVTGDGGVIGVFGLLKRLKGKKPTIVDTNQNAVTLDIHEEGRDVRLVVPLKVWEIAQDRQTQRLMQVIIRPLLSPRMDKIEFREREQNKQLEVLERNDVATMLAIESGNESTNIIPIPRQSLTVVGAVFEPGLKWRLSDGNQRNAYTILDEEFVAKTQDGRERFGAGDTLVCSIRLVQTVSDDGHIATDYQVVRVLEHRMLGVQISFPNT